MAEYHNCILSELLQITASNIRQIEFSPQQNSRRNSAEVSPPVQLLQRQKQDQRSFIVRNTNPSVGVDNSEGQSNFYTPTKSEVEPNISTMVNNTPHEGESSMMQAV